MNGQQIHYHQFCHKPPIVVQPSAAHTATVIFLHGLGDQGDGWAQILKQDLDLNYVKYVVPNAADRRVTLNFGAVMPSCGQNYVHGLIDAEIAAGLPSNRIILGGFSMGAALAIYAGLTYKQKLGCVVSMSGFLLQRTKFPGEHTANLHIPIFLGHGTQDPLVPFAFGQATKQALDVFNPNVQLKGYPGLDTPAFINKKMSRNSSESDEEIQLHDDEGGLTGRKRYQSYNAAEKLDIQFNGPRSEAQTIGWRWSSRRAHGNRSEAAEYIKEKRKNKLPVSRRIISNQAAQLFHGTDMKISVGWLTKFLKRHNFVLRRRTTVCQKPPKDYIDRLSKFIVHVEQRRKAIKFNEILAFDETAVWFDNPESRVIETRGAKDVTVLTTGHEKMRITVGLCARSDGKKSLPYVLVSRKRPDPKIVKRFEGKMVINWAGGLDLDDAPERNPHEMGYDSDELF
uniref:palmitoyl-protein hydrolase n=1 Tax=Ditylenchus dipsaci TaxID=166011 RepID=A0A915EEL4_9BILA